MAKKYHVTLTAEEREQLTALVTKGKAAARTLTHARILLKTDAAEGGPAWTDAAVCAALDVGLCTVMRVRARFVEEGLEAALRPRPSSYVHPLLSQLLLLPLEPGPHGRPPLRFLRPQVFHSPHLQRLSLAFLLPLGLQTRLSMAIRFSKYVATRWARSAAVSPVRARTHSAWLAYRSRITSLTGFVARHASSSKKFISWAP